MSREEPAHWVLTDVSLVIEREGLDPGEVTARLGVSPTNSAAPGEDRRSANPAIGFWMLECDERVSRVFSEQLKTVLEAAEVNVDELRRLQGEGCEVWISVYGFSGNESKLSFSAHDLARLAALGLPLRLVPNLNDR